MSDPHDPAQSAADRAVGLTLETTLQQAARNEERADVTVHLTDDESPNDRRAAARQLASLDRADLAGHAQVAALGEVMARSWSADAAPTLDMLTVVVSETDSRDSALALIDKFAKSAEAKAGEVKIPLLRSLVGDLYANAGRPDRDLTRAQFDEAEQRVTAARDKRARAAANLTVVGGPHPN